MWTRTVRLCSLGCLVFVVGCGPSQDTDSVTEKTKETADAHADPHDVPLTEREIDKLREDTANWTAAVEHISKYRDTIKMETTSGTPAHAHRALDFLDYVLQWLPEIAQKSNVPKDHWQTIGENSQTLRDAFDTIHTHIDNGTSPSYEAVAAEIDAAVESLAAIPGGASSETELPE